MVLIDRLRQLLVLDCQATLMRLLRDTIGYDDGRA